MNKAINDRGMRCAIPLLLLILPITGCFTDHAEVPHRMQASLEDAVGLYSNWPSAKPYPEQIPENRGLPLAPALVGADGDRKDIEYVQIQVDGPLVTITCLDIKRTPLVVKDYVEGEDFDLREGRVTLKSRPVVVGAESQALAVGLGYENIALQLSENRDLVLVESGTAVVLVLELVPMGISGTSAFIYTRVDE